MAIERVFTDTTPRRRPYIVCLIGSTRFKDEYVQANFEFTMAGYIVLTVGWFGHADADVYVPSEREKIDLDVLHLRKIDLADLVYLISPDGYVGDSTRREMAYAHSTGKSVITFSRGVVWHERPTPETPTRADSD